MARAQKSASWPVRRGAANWDAHACASPSGDRGWATRGTPVQADVTALRGRLGRACWCAGAARHWRWWALDGERQFARAGSLPARPRPQKAREQGQRSGVHTHLAAARTGRPSAGRASCGRCPGRPRCWRIHSLVPWPAPRSRLSPSGLSSVELLARARRRTRRIRPSAAWVACTWAPLPTTRCRRRRVPVCPWQHRSSPAASRCPRVLRHSNPSRTGAIRPGPLLTTTTVVVMYALISSDCSMLRIRVLCPAVVHGLFAARRPAGPTASQTTMRSMTAHQNHNLIM
jgi:hypothetical protein